ncbi:RNA recognition motif domain-containing protein [Ditylenchus destructor]|nr:RNA recognition motif domain-containing protein [Ditylenchus destructor]
MTALFRLVGNFRSRVKRLLTKVAGLTPKAKDQSNRSELKVNEMKNPNEIFITGLSERVSKDDLQAYFSRFGEIETCDSFVEYGCVTFKSPNAVKQVLNSAPHYMIGDRFTNANAELVANMKNLMRATYQNRELKVSKNPYGEKMILIEGLSDEISENAIRAYFSQFGDINYCKIDAVRPSGSVNFESPSGVKKALNSAPHYIIGDRITNENDELIALVKESMHTMVQDES